MDNRIIETTNDTVTNINLDLPGRGLEMSLKHASRTTHEDKHLQGHLIPISTKDDIAPALMALCTDHSIALCTDHSIACASSTMYAYRIGNKDKFISNYEENLVEDD